MFQFGFSVASGFSALPAYFMCVPLVLAPAFFEIREMHFKLPALFAPTLACAGHFYS